MTFLPQPLPTTVANVAALATNASKTANGSVISTAGYLTAGDGGAIDVVYRRSGRTALGALANDGIWYFNGPSVDDYWEKVDKSRVDLRQAGCVGDGVTDDTVAFTTAVEVALREGVPLEVPKGEFLLSTLTPINIDGDFTITGVGYASKIIGPNITTTLFNILPTAASRLICTDCNFSTLRDVIHFESMTLANDPHDVTIKNCTCDNFGQGICAPVGGGRIVATSVQVSGNTLTNMGLSLEATDSVHCYAIDVSILECPKTVISNNLIDTVGSLSLTRHVHGIYVDATGSADNSQSVVINDNIVKNVFSAARESTYQICGIMALECHPTITGNVIDNIAGMHPQNITANPATDVITTDVVHVLSTGNWIVFIGDDLPAPLAENTTYYARDCTTYTFKVSATNGGAAIDITDAGSGTMKFSAYHPSSPEAIYTKSSHSVVSNNTIIDVLGTEGVINMKGEFTGSASAERSVISGNSISFRSLPQTAFCTGINCAAPYISVIGNVIEGATRGAVSTFQGTVFSNNVFRSLQSVGIECLPYGVDYDFVFKDNIFIDIGTDSLAYGILINTTGDNGLNLIEIRNNTFKDFNTDSQIAVFIITVSTRTIKKIICNNNIFDGIPNGCIVQAQAGSEADYIEFSFNSLYDANLIFSNNAINKKTRKLLNVLNGGLWVGNTSPTPFDPTAISGCVSWWQPKDRDTVLYDSGTGERAVDGQTVARIKDKSGNDNHINGNGVNPVLQSAETSGLPFQSVYWRGLGDDAMCTLPASCTTDCTMFMVQKTGGNQRFIADAATDVFTAESHGKLNGDVVRFVGDDLPAPLVAATNYYVINRTADTFKVESSLGGGAVDITDAGSGLMRITHIDPLFNWWYQSTGWGSPADKYLWIGGDGVATADGAGSGVGTPSYRKNGTSASYTTRDDVYDSLGNVLSLVTVEGIDFSSWDYGATRMHLGGFLAGTYYVTGHLLECIIYDRALTAAERTAVEEYLIEEHEIV